MHIPSLVENPFLFTRYSPETEIWACLGQITPSKIDEICPLAITNQISTISMHMLSLVKIHWCLLKLSSGNGKRTDGQTYNGRTDGRADGLTDDQRETIKMMRILIFDSNQFFRILLKELKFYEIQEYSFRAPNSLLYGISFFLKIRLPTYTGYSDTSTYTMLAYIW